MNSYRDNRLKIYERTNGKCHICHKKLAYTNYGRFGTKGAWEIEHSIPQSLGGTNYLNNLYAACITCNRCKNNNSTLQARRVHGKTRAPLSRDKRMAVKRANSFAGAIVFGGLGSIFGPLGVFAGSLIGAKIGFEQNPDVR